MKVMSRQITKIAAGCFAGDQLVAAASGYTRARVFTDLGGADRSLVRHRRLGPGQGRRWRGLPPSGRCAREMIPQVPSATSTTLLDRTGVAKGLNFRLHFRQESLWTA